MKQKRKIYSKVITIEGDRGTFAEFGLVKNPTFRNDIYIKVKSGHKERKQILNETISEMRLDEALLLIQALSVCIRRKITGVNLVFPELPLDKK